MSNNFRVFEDPTSSWEQLVTSPAAKCSPPLIAPTLETQHSEVEEQCGQEKGVVPHGEILVWPLTGRAGGTGPVGRGGRKQRRRDTNIRKKFPRCQTAERRAVAHKAHKMHTRNAKAWKTQLTKLMSVKILLCSSAFNRVILSYPLQNVMQPVNKNCPGFHSLLVVGETPKANWNLSDLGMKANSNHRKTLLQCPQVLTSSAISRKVLLTSTQTGNIQLAAVVQVFTVACTNGIMSRDMALNHHLMQKQVTHCRGSYNMHASGQAITVLSVVSGKEQAVHLKVRQTSGSFL